MMIKYARLPHFKAFTLIELLIVVAIIAILAAIAVPNLLEAQTRSKVSRVKADMRAIATAIEAYSVDNNNYPWPLSRMSFIQTTVELSSPVAYVTSVNFHGPFYVNDPSASYLMQPPRNTWYQYYNYAGSQAQSDAWNLTAAQKAKGYSIVSWGPMGLQTASCFIPINGNINALYDPTNGTVSSGEIAYFGGAIKIGGFVR